jgi:hypothetical protein
MNGCGGCLPCGNCDDNRRPFALVGMEAVPGSIVRLDLKSAGQKNQAECVNIHVIVLRQIVIQIAGIWGANHEG